MAPHQHDQHDQQEQPEQHQEQQEQQEDNDKKTKKVDNLSYDIYLHKQRLLHDDPGNYVSPSDGILSPCTQKLSALKGRRRRLGGSGSSSTTTSLLFASSKKTKAGTDTMNQPFDGDLPDIDHGKSTNESKSESENENENKSLSKEALDD